MIDKKMRSKLLPVILVAVIGVFLIIYGSRDTHGGTKSANADTGGDILSYDEARYEEELVRKIEEICREVKGAGRVKVAVTLDGSFKAIYAQNMAEGGSVRHEYLLVGSGSSEKALLLGYSPPEILGVAVVCDGGSSATVRAEMIAIISSLLDIPTNKIYVAGAKN